MKIGTIVRAHLNRERLDVMIAVYTPLVLMAESGYACGWVFADGNLAWNEANTYLSLARGFFLEGLVFAMFKLTRILALSKKWNARFLALLPLLIGTTAMVVSAGCNLGWINRSGEMQHMTDMVSDFMPGTLVEIFKLGLGLLFPLAVGAFALLDVGKLVDEIMGAFHLEERAFMVENAERHRNEMKKGQKQALKQVATQYHDMAQKDAENMVRRVQGGDYSFGLSEFQPKNGLQSGPSVTRLSAPPPPPQLPPPLASFGPTVPLNSFHNPAINSPAMPAGPSTGNTQNIVVPPPPQQPQKKSFWSF